ncbi:hypothetical protein [Halorubrum sp. 2020YC2]|uniref:hypothetical protein n=1 Tax=Halorubrum sp. 2020YC2 TaxID=2836432 RepID=UPI001BE9A796|nr:hypothetical protein [Halorubrum sp. 2020YC2]QWC18976.1 hypothetical protein KI388_12755 [Halorubrum sp. 2020YC2]
MSDESGHASRIAERLAVDDGDAENDETGDPEESDERRVGLIARETVAPGDGVGSPAAAGGANARASRRRRSRGLRTRARGRGDSRFDAER